MSNQNEVLCAFYEEAQKQSNAAQQQEYMLAGRAREGDLEARFQLLLTLQREIVRWVSSSAHTFPHAQDDLQYLVGVADVALLDYFDHALKQEMPWQYLRQQIWYRIRTYCLHVPCLMPIVEVSQDVPKQTLEMIDPDTLSRDAEALTHAQLIAAIKLVQVEGKEQTPKR